MTSTPIPTHPALPVVLSGMFIVSILGLSLAIVPPPASAINATDLDGTMYWQGQTDTVEDLGDWEGDIIQIRPVTDRAGSQTGSAFANPTVSDGSIPLSTGDFDEGTYVLAHADEAYLNAAGTAFDAQTSDEWAEFEVVIQDMQVEFDDTEVRSGESTDVEFESNRAAYTLRITERDESLDDEDLAQIFNAFEDAGGADVLTADDRGDENDHILILEGVAGFMDFEANFTDIDSGEYDIEFSVTDSNAGTTQTITVLEEIDPELAFEQSVYETTRGDIVWITISTEGAIDEAAITIGDADNTGYESTVIVEPTDDGEIELGFNTWVAGGANTASEDPAVPLFHVTDGSYVSHTETVGDETTTEFTDPWMTMSDHASEDTLERVLETGTYDLAVEAHGEEAVASLELQERALGNATILTAPHDQTVETTRDILEGYQIVVDPPGEPWIAESNHIAFDESAAIGDWVIHHVTVTGIHGAFPIDADPDAMFDTVFADGGLADAGMRVTVEETDPPGSLDPATFQFSPADTFVIPDGGNDSLYIAVNTAAIGTDRNGLETGDSFTFELEFDEAFLETYYRDADVPDDGETATADAYEIVQRSLTFDTDNDDVAVSAASEQLITGETNVAPGTELEIRAERSGDGAFLKTDPETVVDQDGNFAAELDFDDIPPDTSFVLRVPDQGFDDDAETPGVTGEGGNTTFEITDLEPGDILIESEDDDETITAEITNTGTQNDTQEVEIRIDDVAVYTDNVTLAPNESTSLTYDILASELIDELGDGEFDYSIVTAADTVSASLTIDLEQSPGGGEDIEETPEPESEPTPEPEPQPGMTLISAVLAMLGVLFVYYRTRV